MELARVRTVLTGFSGAPGVQTTYFRKRTALGWDNYLGELTGRMLASWRALETLIPTTMTYATSGEIDIIEDTTGELLQTQVGAGTTDIGDSTLGYGPLAAGIVITWLTAGVVAGNHVKGRTFIVPCAASVEDADGSPSSTALGFAAAFGNTLRGSGSEAVVPVVYSRPKKVPATTPTQYLRFGSNHDMTGQSVKDTFAVLRSRRD